MNKLYISAEKEFDEFLPIAEERGLGFEIQEFCFPDVMDGNWKERLHHYQGKLSSFKGGLALHNAFSGLLNVCIDPQLIELTKKRYDLNFHIAEELQVKHIIVHLHWLPHDTGTRISTWQEGQAQFWDHYVNLAEKKDFTIVAENIYEPRPEIIKGVLDKIGSERFKFNFDVGHFNVVSETSLDDWLLTFGKELVYMHVHNNYGGQDEHGSVIRGTFNYDYLFSWFEKLGIAPILCTEMFNKNWIIESIDYLQKKVEESAVYTKKGV